MKLCQKKSFYIFNGCWFDVFDKLVGILQPGNARQFTVWESRKTKTGHLLIAYGTKLPPDLQSRHDLKEITEPEFWTNIKPTLSERVVHGFNEFHSRKFKLKFPWFHEN
jgi:hypothetical protein